MLELRQKLMKQNVSKFNFATRLNSFLYKYPNTNSLMLLEKISKIQGLEYVDLNYPEHTTGVTPNELKLRLNELNLKLNSIEMRYNKLDDNSGVLALASNEQKKRNKAVDVTLKAIDYLKNSGGTTLSIWPSLEGYDYSFQINYYKSYEALVHSLRRICDYDKSIKISIEFKPQDLYSFSLVPNFISSVLLANDVGTKNIGVTMDFCHLLMSHESPAASLDMAFHKTNVFGIHLNDGYSFRDDGLIVGSVHPIQTLETISVLNKNKFKGVIYFDTFPVYLDPVSECQQNIKYTNYLLKAVSGAKSSDIIKVFDINKFLSRLKK